MYTHMYMYIHYTLYIYIYICIWKDFGPRGAPLRRAAARPPPAPRAPSGHAGEISGPPEQNTDASVLCLESDKGLFISSWRRCSGGTKRAP